MEDTQHSFNLDAFNAKLREDTPETLRMSLQSAKRQCSDVRKNIVESVRAVMEATRTVKEFGDQKHIELLEKTILGYIKQHIELDMYLECLEELGKKNGDLPEDLSGHIANYIEQHTAAKVKTFKSHGDYKKFCAIAEIEREEDSDEDMVMETGERSTNCPITQQLIVHPVFNTTCKHCYTKEAIMGYLKGKPSVACPIAGCNKQVRANTLERDVEMEVLIERVQSGRGTESSNHHQNDAGIVVE